jgi:ASC-1-like (ASCH) protein
MKKNIFTIEINIQEPYYGYSLSGEKSVEGRLNKGKFKEIQAGDFLLMNNEHKFKVIKKNIYKSFKEMIVAEGMDNVVPDKDNIYEASNVYYKFYTKEQESEFGVVAIKIKKA